MAALHNSGSRRIVCENISGKKKRRMRKLGVGGSGEHEKRQLLKEVCMRQEKCVFCSNS